MTYIHPLEMMIKTLRAQMGSKTFTRVPSDKIASSSEKLFSRYVSSFSCKKNKKCHKHVTNAPKGIGLA